MTAEGCLVLANAEQHPGKTPARFDLEATKAHWPGAAPEQRHHLLGSSGPWTAPWTLLMCACVSYTPFPTPLSHILELNKISPYTGHQFWDLFTNKDQQEKILRKSASPQSFPVDNYEFHCINITTLTPEQKPKSFSLANSQRILFLSPRACHPHPAHGWRFRRNHLDKFRKRKVSPEMPATTMLERWVSDI